jgi:formylglycine-generating enzyme required for sulfatase activity
MRITFGVLIYCLFLCVPVASWADNTCNPSPAEGDLILPAPNGQCLVFRAIGIGEGDDPVAAQRRFTMGDASGGFRESPINITLGGNFLIEKVGTDTGDWVYYLGKYAVTEGLYHSVMGLPQGKDPSLLKSTYPITSVSYFDALAFIDKLNTWLYANAMDKLPKSGKTPGFLRLPTEVEWEFAARGGNNVPPDIFGDRMPYQDTLAGYEWFSGPTSSYNKVQPVGSLKPNPLGLYDMLGNVSEMVSNTYQIEYFQGRNGGLTSRGGHFLTREHDVRSSLRTEEPMYIGDSSQGMRPNAKPIMGFRLVFGSSVLVDREAINAIEDAWEAYRTSGGARFPAALSTAPAHLQVELRMDDAHAYMDNIKGYLATGKAPESIMQDFGRLGSALADTVRIRHEADERVARASVRTAVTTAARIAREMPKLPTIEDLLKTARETNDEGMLARMGKIREDILGNINTDMSDYYETLSALIVLPKDVVDAAFSLHSAYLKNPSRKEAAQWQLQVIGPTQAHYEQFFRDKRGNAEVWRKDFSEVEGVITQN